ncbi:2-dehydro-3-deoxygalactonokinase [Sphingomonas sp.]|uniref:2-dehydro-3-deoxygalactonokinase n=1 Tax=Sphingomonas sp. TaxID=28214 RepID=UPI002FC6A812
MRWAEGFIAVDWGTTNRRGYLIGSDGSLEQEMEDDQGILSVPPEGFPSAVAELRARLGDRPLLMAGMIGSNRGWVEARYVPTPAGLDDLAHQLTWAEPGFAAIIPGVSHSTPDRADVMRGEEVQILGAVATGMVSDHAMVCHPGTHNKWASVIGGRIASFRTVMTGELFNLLKEHSILADLLSHPAVADSSFELGVEHGLAHDDLTSELFAIRARTLLGRAPAEQAASYTSGLLIGNDLRIGLRAAPVGEIIVMGRPELTRLFAVALKVAGREAREIDGEEAFLAGVRKLAELIR